MLRVIHGWLPYYLPPTVNIGDVLYGAVSYRHGSPRHTSLILSCKYVYRSMLYIPDLKANVRMLPVSDELSYFLYCYRENNKQHHQPPVHNLA